MNLALIGANLNSSPTGVQTKGEGGSMALYYYTLKTSTPMRLSHCQIRAWSVCISCFLNRAQSIKRSQGQTTVQAVAGSRLPMRYSASVLLFPVFVGIAAGVYVYLPWPSCRAAKAHRQVTDTQSGKSWTYAIYRIGSLAGRKELKFENKRDGHTVEGVRECQGCCCRPCHIIHM